jgi:2-dehydro-3-deoxygluconokinase
MKIACIGEVMIELALTSGSQDAHVGVAGDTFNTAVYLKRTGGEHLDVAYITVLGTDSFSDQIIHSINSEHIDTHLIPRSSQRVPGLYAISTDERGERSFTYWREQSAARLMFDDSTGPLFNVLDAFDVLYYSAITLAILPPAVRKSFLAYLAEFRALPGRRVAFDSNYRPRLWHSQDEARHYVSSSWQHCDIALPSLDDEMALFGDADETAVMHRLRTCGVITGAIKRGAQGPLDLQSPATTPAFESVNLVVDSTAAGDSFNGAYLACLLDGGNPVQAMQAGHDCASHVVQHRGAIVEKHPG